MRHNEWENGRSESNFEKFNVKDKVEADGSDIVANTPGEFAALMRADYRR